MRQSHPDHVAEAARDADSDSNVGSDSAVVVAVALLTGDAVLELTRRGVAGQKSDITDPRDCDGSARWPNYRQNHFNRWRQAILRGANALGSDVVRLCRDR
ncbi:MAG: hypothetical protein COY47_04865 [Chloroflexi bacterium CG_4_10_14_0_8_um_filter_57_5]|nr:MAG: hypothetical protein COY47_04865 [Chloroflexi bacterium CG_4_10_14_0_8_um_filter_57_5]